MQLLHLPLELLLLTLENLDVTSLTTFLATSPSLTTLLTAVSPSLIRRHPTLLHSAAAANYPQLLQHLLTLLPATTLDARQHTPLFRAAEAGALDTVALLQHTPEPSRKFAVETPLAVAARNGRLPVVRLLLSTSAACAPRALISAAGAGHKDVVELLLPSVVGGAERTAALCAASSAGHEGVVRFLLSSGVQAARADSDGSTPLHHASRGGSLEVLNVLLERSEVREKIDAQDCHGWTPLHWAVFKEWETGRLALVEAGADAQVRNDDGLPAGGWEGDDEEVARWERMLAPSEGEMQQQVIRVEIAV
jgi:ankyrin repeat protein